MAIDDIKSKFETFESDNRPKARPGINSGNKNKCLVGFKRFLRTSRFSGLPFAVVYGLFIYFYVTYLILSDPATSPKSVSESAINSSRYAHALPFRLEYFGRRSVTFSLLVDPCLAENTRLFQGPNGTAMTTVNKTQETTSFRYAHFPSGIQIDVILMPPILKSHGRNDHRRRRGPLLGRHQHFLPLHEVFHDAHSTGDVCRPR